MRRLLPVSIIVMGAATGLWIFACGEDVGNQGAGDAGAEKDAGSPLEDTGQEDSAQVPDSGGAEDTGAVDAGLDAAHDDSGLDAGAADAGADGGHPLDGGTDSGVDAGRDAGVDSGAPDAGADAGTDGGADAGADGGADSGFDAGLDAGNCTPDPQTPADGARTVLVAHPFGATGSDCGRKVEVLKLDAAGTLAQTGTQIDVDDCPNRIAFSPDGRLVIISSYNDHVAPHPMSVKVYRHTAAGALVFDRAIPELQGTNPYDIVFNHAGTKAYVSDFDGQGGVHVIDVIPGCTAGWRKKIDLFTPTTMKVLPGDTHMILIGGENPIDTTVIDLDAEAVAAAYDLFSDMVDAQSIALSPDAKHLLVPNSSPYSALGNTLSVLAIDSSWAHPVPSLLATTQNVSEPSGVAYSPDGTKALATNFSANTTRWFAVGADAKLTTGGTLSSMPLADRVAPLNRGPNAGVVLVTTLSDVNVLKWTNTGLTKQQKLTLSSGNDGMTGDIAIEP